MKNKNEIMIGVLLLIVISFLTIGYAQYSRLITLNGVSTFKKNGVARISNFIVADSSNVSTETHTINGLNVNFSVKFNNVGQNADYHITYEITIVNDSFYDYEFTQSTCVPDVSATNSTVNVSYQVSGISEGEKIKPGASKTFQVKVMAAISDDHSGDINISGDIENDMEQEVVGSLIGTIAGSNSGNLVNNELASFNTTVINTFEYNKTFDLVLANSNNFSIVNCNGSALSSMTIAKNSTQNFEFCIKKNAGVEFASSPQNIAVYLRSEDLADYPVGSLSLEVPVTVVVTDDDAPVISGLTVTKTFGSKGNVVLSWNGTDENNISKYYIIVTKEGENPVTVNTLADETTYTFTDIDENVNYTFVVYGEDEFRNSGASGASNPSTSSGIAVTSGTKSFNWTYSVSFDLSGLTSNGASSVLEGRDYSASLSANFLRTIPSNLNSVKMGGTTLSKCSNATNCKGYTYSNGNITVYNVTGNLEISATGGNSCLAKGTKVLLANGKYKNIENVKYDDLLAVWNYETGKITYEYPIWIEKEKTTNSYQKATFSDGSVLKTIGWHGVYDLDNKRFVSVDNPKEFKIGTKIAKIKNGKIIPITVKSIERINKQTTYYHIVSTTYYNIIANDMLTTDGTTILSNLYGFDDNIKWPKSRNKIVKDSNNLYDYEQLHGSLPYYMFKGLRAAEAKYIVNLGYMSDEMLEYYFMTNQSNPDMLLPPINKDGSNYWPVSIDNKKYGLIKEGEDFTLPNKKVKCYYNTSDSKCYKPNEKIKIYYGTHFISK